MIQFSSEYRVSANSIACEYLESRALSTLCGDREYRDEYSWYPVRGQSTHFGRPSVCEHLD